MRYVVLLVVICFTQLLGAQNHQMAQNYFEKGDFEKAQLSYEKLFEKQPHNDLYVRRLVDCYQQLQKYDQALEILKRKVDRRQYQYLVGMGYTYQLQKKSKKADKKYQEAIDKIKKQPGLAYSIGAAFEKKTLLDWALKSYEVAKEKNPNVNFNFQKALIYGQKGDMDNMIELFITEARDTPPRKANIQQHLAQFMLNDVDDVFKNKLRKALLLKAQKDKDVFWNGFLSWYFIQNKNFSSAFRQQKAIVRRDPNLFKGIVDLVYLAIEEKDKAAAQEIAAYILEQTINDGLRLSLEHQLLSYELETIQESQYLSFGQKIDQLISQYGDKHEALDILILSAHFKAFYQSNSQAGIDLLQPVLTKPNSMVDKAKVKMELADILTLQEKFNQGLIYYSQVEMDLKNNPIGHQASFKVAKTSYYKGDFEWALKQLKVLKSSSSLLIANDALDVYLLITDNNQIDTTYTALKAFAKADFKVYQNRKLEALIEFNDVMKNHSHDVIQEPTAIRIGQLQTDLKNYSEAITTYEVVIDKFPESIYVDEAYYFAAELYAQQQLPQKAKAYYEKIVLEHPDSIYFSKAQKAYRTLRGDKQF